MLRNEEAEKGIKILKIGLKKNWNPQLNRGMGFRGKV